MRVIGYRMADKFGRDSLTELLGVRAGDERYREVANLGATRREIRAIGNEPILLLFHGLPANYAELRALHLERDGLYTLFVSSVRSGPEVAVSGLERVGGLDFEVASLGNWEGHSARVRRTMAAFVQCAADPKSTEPQWDLLKRPAAPEHVIACYLAALADRSSDLVRDGWRQDFEDEVEGMQRESRRGATCQLTWGDRTDASKLGDFLREAYFIEGSA